MTTLSDKGINTQYQSKQKWEKIYLPEVNQALVNQHCFSKYSCRLVGNSQSLVSRLYWSIKIVFILIFVISFDWETSWKNNPTLIIAYEIQLWRLLKLCLSSVCPISNGLWCNTAEHHTQNVPLLLPAARECLVKAVAEKKKNKKRQKKPPKNKPQATNSGLQILSLPVSLQENYCLVQWREFSFFFRRMHNNLMQFKIQVQRGSSCY